MTAPHPDPGRRARMAETLARVAAEFRQELPGRMDQARSHLHACLDTPGSDASLRDLLLLLHSLAGTAGTLGLGEVGDASRACERMTQALCQQADRTVADFARLQECVAHLSALVQRACTDPG